MLVERALLTQAALDDALAGEAGSGKRLGEYLVDTGILDERDLAGALAEQFDLEVVDLREQVPDDEAVAGLPELLPGDPALGRGDGPTRCGARRAVRVPRVRCRGPPEGEVGADVPDGHLRDVDRDGRDPCRVGPAPVHIVLRGTRRRAPVAHPDAARPHDPADAADLRERPVLAVERFCRLISAMMKAGVPLPETMQGAIEGTNNQVFAKAFGEVRDAMPEGEEIAEPRASPTTS
ncbi:MAG: hypothetical protein FJW88_06900 [Actinobacteria bacterium]|nr:hypothetical protein [Actinomycetota bacterium]